MADSTLDHVHVYLENHDVLLSYVNVSTRESLDVVLAVNTFDYCSRILFTISFLLSFVYLRKSKYKRPLCMLIAMTLSQNYPSNIRRLFYFVLLITVLKILFCANFNTDLTSQEVPERMDSLEDLSRSQQCPLINKFYSLSHDFELGRTKAHATIWNKAKACGTISPEASDSNQLLKIILEAMEGRGVCLLPHLNVLFVTKIGCNMATDKFLTAWNRGAQKIVSKPFNSRMFTLPLARNISAEKRSRVNLL